MHSPCSTFLAYSSPLHVLHLQDSVRPHHSKNQSTHVRLSQRYPLVLLPLTLLLSLSSNIHTDAPQPFRKVLQAVVVDEVVLHLHQTLHELLLRLA